MSAENKAANKVTEVKGKVKKETGAAIGNEQMEAEGKADQAKGNVRQAAPPPGQVAAERGITCRRPPLSIPAASGPRLFLLAARAVFKLAGWEKWYLLSPPAS
jgi:uncharacterized protein YjbJ (UPF0337 family)